MLRSALLRMPGMIHLGKGLAFDLPALMKPAKSVALFTDKGVRSTGLIDRIMFAFEKAGITVFVFDDLPPEPTILQANNTIKAFRAVKAQIIVAVGGGSVMDVAKLASVLDTDEYTIYDLLDNPMQARKFIPTLMVPTTAGTGAEATPNAIVTLPEKALKVGIVNPEMIADTVVLDAEMARDLPQKIAASTGIDALAHAVECYTSAKATAISNIYAGEAFRLIESSIEAACDPNNCDMQAKENMLLASFLAGVAITASGTTGVHALSYPLGGRYHIPHGISNAILLMPVMRFNESACQTEFAKLYDIILPGGCASDEEEKSSFILNRMEDIVRKVGIVPSLKPWNVGLEDLDTLVDASMQVTRLLVNNKRPITKIDAKRIYQEIL